MVVTQLLTFLDYLGNSKLFELYLFYHHSHRNAENVEKTNLVPADDLVEYHFLGMGVKGQAKKVSTVSAPIPRRRLIKK